MLFFFLFQQTPVFWEEEEVSGLFFFFNTLLSFLPVLLKQLEVHLSGLPYWHICIPLMVYGDSDAVLMVYGV